jgi:hypothetical protein
MYNNIIAQAQQFKQQFSNINPRAEVEKLLYSGQMSQEQFNFLSQQANQILKMMKN